MCCNAPVQRRHLSGHPLLVKSGTDGGQPGSDPKTFSELILTITTTTITTNTTTAFCYPRGERCHELRLAE